MAIFHSLKRVRVCPECDLTVALPPLTPGQKALCPRCQHSLAERKKQPVQRVVAWSLAALLLLMLALEFNFVSFSTSGLGETISLTDTMRVMLSRGEVWVALILTLTMVVLPICYLLGIIYVHLSVVWRTHPAQRWPGQLLLARWISMLQPWLMADVFLIGAVVSLVKVAVDADVDFGIGFWAYGAFALVVIHTGRCFDKDWLWFALVGEPSMRAGAKSRSETLPRIQIGESGTEQHVIGCHVCGAVNRQLLKSDIEASKQRQRCFRCGVRLSEWVQHSQRRTLMLLLAAMILYVPANVLPIMITVDISGALPSTIIGGVMELWQNGSEPVAVIIFIASIIVPVVKILVLIYLLWHAQMDRNPQPDRSMLMYRVTDLVGRWSMIDVFAVAILVALVQAGAIMSVYPGPAAAAFASVVVLTMLAAYSFDTRQLWVARKGVSGS